MMIAFLSTSQPCTCICSIARLKAQNKHVMHVNSEKDNYQQASKKSTVLLRTDGLVVDNNNSMQNIETNLYLMA